VTTTPTSSVPAKPKSSATITVNGKKSQIDITGFTFGLNYIFSVVAINAAGGSTATVTVTFCTPNTVKTLGKGPFTVSLNGTIEDSITIGETTGATRFICCDRFTTRHDCHLGEQSYND
jgi:hypothetical protein